MVGKATAIVEKKAELEKLIKTNIDNYEKIYGVTVRDIMILRNPDNHIIGSDRIHGNIRDIHIEIII